MRVTGERAGAVRRGRRPAPHAVLLTRAALLAHALLHAVLLACAAVLVAPAHAHAALPAAGGTVVHGSGWDVVRAVDQTGQVLLYVGILGASGLVLFRLLVLDRAAPVRLLRPTAQLAAVGLVGLFLVFVSAGARLVGAGPSGFVDPELLWHSLTSRTGAATALGAGGLALALAGRGRVVPLLGVVLALVSLPLTGHTRSFGPGWLVVGSDLLHVLAGSVWFGGLLGLLLTLRSAGVETPAAARTVARFSDAAAWLVLTLAASGTVLAWVILPEPAALGTTGYGLVLLAKVATVACVLAVAAWNRFRLVPLVAAGGSRSLLRRTVGVEATALLLVLSLTGVLVSQSPV